MACAPEPTEVLPPSIPGFKFGQFLGQGKFWRGFLVKKDSVPSCVWVFKEAIQHDNGYKEAEIIKAELTNMKMLKHMNLMPMLQSGEYHGIIYCLIPVMGYRSCAEIVSRMPVGMPEEAIGIIFLEVVKALDYLHNNQLSIHRAVCGRHIYISDSGAVVLGSLRFLISTLSSERVHMPDLCHLMPYLNWLSPELILQDSTGYSTNSDVYSLGITACELANGEVPYDNMNATTMLVNKLELDPPYLLDKKTIRPTGTPRQATAVNPDTARRCDPLASAISALPSSIKSSIIGPASTALGRLSKKSQTPIIANRKDLESVAGPSSAGALDSVHKATYDPDQVEESAALQESREQRWKLLAAKHFTTDFHHFVKVCVEKDPFQRPDIRQLTKHKFLKTYINCMPSDLIHLLHLHDPLAFVEGIQVEEEREMRQPSPNDPNWKF